MWDAKKCSQCSMSAAFDRLSPPFAQRRPVRGVEVKLQKYRTVSSSGRHEVWMHQGEQCGGNTTVVTRIKDGDGAIVQVCVYNGKWNTALMLALGKRQDCLHMHTQALSQG